ncbi:MAG: heavy-metal-associated domain-containing protein [Sulfuriferula sp.]
MRHIVLNISGMTCSGCSNSVKKVLTALPGVTEVDVSLEHSNAAITFDPEKSDAEVFKAAIATAGFEVT